MSKPTIIKATNLIEKRNLLNEMKITYFTMQEARIFSIYLSKVNARDIDTRLVRFKLDDFLAIVNIRKANISKLMETTNKLLSIIINIPDDNGGYSAFQLFKKCKVYKDNENNEWCFEIDAHDEALPLIFELQNMYFTYEIGNLLRLNSFNQMRMYEILKQYETAGSRVLSIEKLKELLGIQKNEYPRFNNFKQWVLDSCQRALQENTDITFTYEPHGKRGQGGKILFLKFTISKNKNFADQLSLAEFIENQKQESSSEKEEPAENRYTTRIFFLIEACNNEFSQKEIIVLYHIMMDKFPYEHTHDDIWMYDYLNRKYQELAMRDEKNPIKHRFSYLKKIIEADKEEYL